jgi:anthranilate phosphoribosyltransferase
MRVACKLLRLGMEFTGHIRRLLMRSRGASALDAQAASRLWGALLDGALDDIEVGAVLGALATAGESGEELVELQRAVQARLAPWSPPGTGPVVAIPAYGCFAGEAAIVALAAMLLRRFDLRVVVHGVLDAPFGVSCARVLRELDVMPSASLAQAGEELARKSIAFLPVQLMSPALARLLALRARLGVETCVHRVAQALDPTHGAATRIVLNAGELCGAAMEALVASIDGDALALTWSGAQPPATLALRPRIERFHAGQRELLFEADAHEIAALPMPHDARGIAAIVRAIATGRAPVPVAALNLLAACLFAAGRAPDLPCAKAAAAVAGRRLAA